MHRTALFVTILLGYTNAQVVPYGAPSPAFGAADVFRPSTHPAGRPFGYRGPHEQYNPYYNRYNNVEGPNVPILSYTNTQDGQGSYSFSFTTGDGKQVQESGYLKDAYIDNAGEPQGTQVVQGSYAYIAPDGTPIEVSYVADENGYRPSGVHIPADGKEAAAPFPLPNPIPVPGDKTGRINYDPYYNRQAPYDRYEPYYRNDGRNYYGNKFDHTRYNNNYDPARLHNGPKYFQDRYRNNNDVYKNYNNYNHNEAYKHYNYNHNNAYRHFNNLDGYKYNKPDWKNNTAFVPLTQEKAKDELNKE